MKCKVCKKKLLPVSANGSIRSFKLGFYCPKCKRLIPEKSRIKEKSTVDEEL